MSIPEHETSLRTPNNIDTAEESTVVALPEDQIGCAGDTTTTTVPSGRNDVRVRYLRGQNHKVLAFFPHDTCGPITRLCGSSSSIEAAGTGSGGGTEQYKLVTRVASKTESQSVKRAPKYCIDPDAVHSSCLQNTLEKSGMVRVMSSRDEVDNTDAAPHTSDQQRRRSSAFRSLERQNSNRLKKDKEGSEAQRKEFVCPPGCVLYWAKRLSIEEITRLPNWTKANHFPGSWCIGRKDNLHKLVTTVLYKQFPEIFQGDTVFTPMSFLCPSEMPQLERYVTQNGGGNIMLIMKPVDLACGKGIHVASGTWIVERLKSNKSEKYKGKPYIVQEYVDKPLLVDGRKWDLRVYVAVTNYNPLRCYVYREGLVRFATLPYEDEDSLQTTAAKKKKYQHLTNFSVNKKCDDYDVERSKWLFGKLKEAVGEGIWSDVWSQIRFIIAATFLAASTHITPQLVRCRRHQPDQTNLFELYGFDVLVSRTASCGGVGVKATLLEVNLMPDLATGSLLDSTVKCNLVADLLTLVGVCVKGGEPLEEGFREAVIRGEEMRMGNFEVVFPAEDTCARLAPVSLHVQKTV